MCCYVSTAGDDAPDLREEDDRACAADVAVYGALASLQLALIRQTGVGTIISAGKVDADLDQRIEGTERAVEQALAAYRVALCAQARGEPYRLLDASHGGVARAMRFRLAQNRTVRAIEVRVARLPAVVSAEVV